MKKAIYFLSLPIILFAVWSFSNNTSKPSKIEPFIYNLPDTSILEPEAIHVKKAQVVTGLINYNHYSKKELNDDISSALLDEYISNLDYNRYYFQDSDIKRFNNYRYSLDDDLMKGRLETAYEIYNIYKQRFLERAKKNLEIIKKDFDFSIDEYLVVDREKAPWAKNDAELDELWRKRIKNEVLGLVLSNKTVEESREVIQKRYERLIKGMNQMKSEDVFQLYMNSFSVIYDPHTSYFSPFNSQNFNMDMNKSFEGIGARLQSQDDYTLVREIIPGGPAFKGKELKANDKIIGVAQGDDSEFTDVVGWRLDEVVGLIRGAKGTVVRLQILSDDDAPDATPHVVRLVRDKIKLEEQSASKKVISYDMNGKKYKMGVITIPSFYIDFEEYRSGIENYKSTTNDVRKLLTELDEEGVDGLIIDLRYNGGGALQEAIDLSGLFIKKGTIVQVKSSNGKIRVYADEDPAKVYNGPLTVMVNSFSASASEIFAGAIQDYKRGVIIGEQTYGKGTVQNLLDLQRYIEDEKGGVGQLKLTFSKYYRATGSSTQHNGVTPDIVLPSLYSQDEVGESSEPTALPWDEIASSKFIPENDLSDDILNTLKKSFNKRLNADDELKQLIANIQEIQKLRDRDKISLQKAKREKEAEEYNKNKAERDKLFGQDKESENADGTLKTEDPYLKNAMHVTVEMLEDKDYQKIHKK